MSVLFIGISEFAHASTMPQNPMTGNAAELLNPRLRPHRKAPCTPFRRWLWCGFGVALMWLWWGFGGALRWLWWGLGGALGWLCTPESMPSICLLYGFAVASGGLSVQGSGFRVRGSMLDVRCWMFDVRVRLGPAGGASTPEGQNRAQSTAHGGGNVLAAVQQVAPAVPR